MAQHRTEGAWVRGTWVDAAVLAQLHRSAEGRFAVRLSSGETAAALVAAGLAARLADGSLLGTFEAMRAAEEGGLLLDEEPAHAAPRVDLGRWCSSAHHLQPMPAEIAGTRARGADDPHREDVSLCGRCADLLGDAGFFVAA